MNAEVYLFGDLGEGYTQYVNDNTRTLFKSFVSRNKANSQLIIHREDTFMYYTYIRRFRSTESSNRYIGISYVLNNRFIKDIVELLDIFEKTITTLATRGVILEYTNSGEIISSLGKLYKAESEFAHISATLKTELESFMVGKDDTLPTLDYSINTTETKIYKYTDAKAEIINALSTYPTVFIIKDKDYEDPKSKDYASILSRLNKENQQLIATNVKLNLQKKRTTTVTILSILIAIGVIAIISFANRSSKQSQYIEWLETDNEELNTHIDSLQQDSIRLAGDLDSASIKLNQYDSRITSLRQDSALLKTKNNELSDELKTANQIITTYRKSVKQLEKSITEKKQKIKNLESQLSSKSTSTSTSTSSISISDVSVASVDKKGHIVNGFGSTIHASNAYYIRVRMTYKSSVSGYKNITIKLYGLSSGYTLYDIEDDKVYVHVSSSSSMTYVFTKLLGKSGSKLSAGRYKIEIWEDGKLLKTHYFLVC